MGSSFFAIVASIEGLKIEIDEVRPASTSDRMLHEYSHFTKRYPRARAGPRSQPRTIPSC
jgi:hypothetical protein